MGEETVGGEVLLTEKPARPQLPGQNMDLLAAPPGGPSLLPGTVVSSLGQPIAFTSLGKGA